MFGRLACVITLTTLVVACNGEEERRSAGADEGASMAAAESSEAGLVSTICQPVERMPLEGRASPYDSTVVQVGGAEVKVCYGRPAKRDRVVFGELVPYDTIWRTGANEPTTIHLPISAEIAGLEVGPGSYSLYTIPGRDSWTVILNRSTSQWGIESQYTDEIRAEEVGRASVPVESLGTPVEMFTITGQEASPDSANLVLEWDQARVRVPVSTVGAGG